MAKFPLDANRYKILCQIGISEHSVIYKAICESVNSTTVAVKVVDMDGLDWDRDDVKNIINSLSLIQHPNILSPHCSFMMDRQLWIVMPFIHAGSLETLMASRFQNGLPDQFLAILLHQLLSGLACLHQLGYVHKDIKPSNIFIDSEGTVKLSDVNVFNRPKAASDEYSSLLYWVAPEVVGRSDSEYSSKSDVWGIGIVALEIAYGCPPISDSRALMSPLSKILQRFPYILNNNNVDKTVSKNVMYSKLSDLFKDFVTCCLVKDPCKRPSITSLLAHPFVKKGEHTNLLFKSIGKDTMGVEYRFEQSKDRLMSLMNIKNDPKDDDDDNNQSGKIKHWDLNNFVFELETVPFGGESINIRWVEEGEFGRKHVDSSDDAKALLSPLQESFEKVIVLAGQFMKEEKERSFLLESVMKREIKRLNAELMASLKLETELKIQLNNLRHERWLSRRVAANAKPPKEGND